MRSSRSPCSAAGAGRPGRRTWPGGGWTRAPRPSDLSPRGTTHEGGHLRRDRHGRPGRAAGVPARRGRREVLCVGRRRSGAGIRSCARCVHRRRGGAGRGARRADRRRRLLLLPGGLRRWASSEAAYTRISYDYALAAARTAQTRWCGRAMLRRRRRRRLRGAGRDVAAEPVRRRRRVPGPGRRTGPPGPPGRRERRSSPPPGFASPCDRAVGERGGVLDEGVDAAERHRVGDELAAAGDRPRRRARRRVPRRRAGCPGRPSGGRPARPGRAPTGGGRGATAGWAESQPASFSALACWARTRTGRVCRPRCSRYAAERVQDGRR